MAILKDLTVYGASRFVGDVFTGMINTVSTDIGTTAITKVYCSNDNYIKYTSATNFINSLNAYWANIKVSSASNTATTPQFARIGLGTTVHTTYSINANNIIYTSNYLYAGTGVYIKGTGNIIGSNGNNTDLWFGCNGKYINFDAANNVFRRGTDAANANIALGTSVYPWYTTYSGGLHHSAHDNNDSVLLAGGGYKALSEITNDIASADTVSFTKSLQVTEAWMDTGITINETNFPKGDGTYIIQIVATSVNSSNDRYDRYYSGIMSVYTGVTNATNSDEIILHNASHASIKRLYLRIIQQSSNSNYKLQIAAETAYASAHNLIFKFRKMI